MEDDDDFLHLLGGEDEVAAWLRRCYSNSKREHRQAEVDVRGTLHEFRGAVIEEISIRTVYMVIPTPIGEFRPRACFINIFR